MRIIGGYYKGTRINSPPVSGVRPTSDRVREALFNIISGSIQGAVFADLFAGSGSVGIEAISRGAGTCIFIEKNNQCVKIIRENLKRLKIPAEHHVFQSDVIYGIRQISELKRGVDYFYIDPPYRSAVMPDVINAIREKGLLKKEGVVIIEHYKKNKLLLDNSWVLLDTRIYGNTALSFLQIK